MWQKSAAKRALFGAEVWNSYSDIFIRLAYIYSCFRSLTSHWERSALSAQVSDMTVFSLFYRAHWQLKRLSQLPVPLNHIINHISFDALSLKDANQIANTPD